MREAELARARLAVPEEFQLTAGRLGAWPSLIMSHWLVPTASLPGHLCGVAAGLAHVYGARAAAWLWRCLRRGARPGWRRAPPAPVPALLDLGSSDHPGLGWLDLGSQVLLGCGTVLMAHLAAAQRKG